MREEQVNYNELKNEAAKLHSVEKTAKQSLDRVAQLEELVARLQAELADEKAAKDVVVREKDNLKTEKDSVSRHNYSNGY